jgi:hypothetical protein
MTVEQGHTTDGIDLLVSPVVLSANSGVATLVGATVAGWVRLKASPKTKTMASSCVVESATSVRAIWSPGTLPVGGWYNLQVFATPIGHSIQTIVDIDIFLKEAAGP